MSESPPVESKYARVDDERVRDHLANERTYLAWLRTGVAMLGFGIVIEKLRHVSSESVLSTIELGLIFSLIGVLTIVMAVVFFLQTRREIRERTYTSRLHLTLTMAVLIVALGLGIVWFLTAPMLVSR